MFRSRDPSRPGADWVKAAYVAQPSTKSQSAPGLYDCLLSPLLIIVVLPAISAPIYPSICHKFSITVITEILFELQLDIIIGFLSGPVVDEQTKPVISIFYC